MAKMKLKVIVIFAVTLIIGLGRIFFEIFIQGRHGFVNLIISLGAWPLLLTAMILVLLKKPTGIKIATLTLLLLTVASLIAMIVSPHQTIIGIVIRISIILFYSYTIFFLNSKVFSGYLNNSKP